MRDDFAKRLTLVRKERGISQKQAAADLGSGMDFDVGAPHAPLGNPAGDKFHSVPVKPIGFPVRANGLEAVVQQQDRKSVV